MEAESTDKIHPQPSLHPACFGDEAKFVAYVEAAATEGECASCPSEDECGELILLKWSRELFF